MEKTKKMRIMLIIGIIGILSNIIILSYLECYCIWYFITQFTFYKNTNDFAPGEYVVESIIIGLNLVISGFLLEVAVSKIKLLNTKYKKEL